MARGAYLVGCLVAILAIAGLWVRWQDEGAVRPVDKAAPEYPNGDRSSPSAVNPYALGHPVSSVLGEPQLSGQSDKNSDKYAAEVSFRVAISGSVTDSKGSPVCGARVLLSLRLASDEGQDETSPYEAAITDAAGGFRFEHRSVHTHGAGGQVLLLRAAHDEYLNSDELDLGELKNNSKLGDLRLVLREGATITGRVRDTEGNPIRWAYVHVFDWHGEMVPLPEAHGNVCTDAGGWYSIKGRPEGSTPLHVRAVGYSQKALRIEVSVIGNQVNAADDIILSRLPSVTFTLAGAALESCPVRVRLPDGQSLPVQFFGNGAYLVELPGPGTWQLTIIAGEANEWAPLELLSPAVQAGEHMSLGTLNLQPGENPKQK